MSCSSFLTSIVASPGEGWLFVGTGDGAIVLVNLHECRGGSSGEVAIAGAGGQHELEGHTAAVSSLLCVDQGSLLISASEDGGVRAWDVASRQCIQTTDLKAPVSSLLAAPPPLDSRQQENEQDLAPLAPLRKYGQAGAAGGGLKTAYLPLRQYSCAQETGRSDTKRLKLGSI